MHVLVCALCFFVFYTATTLGCMFMNLGQPLRWHNHNSCWNYEIQTESFISLCFLTYVKFNLSIYSADETSMTSC